VINLVRDVLDQLLVDRNDRYVGRVDGIVLERRANRPPLVAAVEISATTMARRVHPLFERMVRPIASWLGADPVVVPLSTINKFGLDIHLDVDADRDPRFLKFEKWLSRMVIQKIPGGRK
jgi:hypothetical protein